MLQCNDTPFCAKCNFLTSHLRFYFILLESRNITFFCNFFLIQSKITPNVERPTFSHILQKYVYMQMYPDKWISLIYHRLKCS